MNVANQDLPLGQRPTWLELQKKDPTHAQLFKLIKLGQQHEKKSRNKTLKLLHNMYGRGLIFIASDGLIQVKHADARQANLPKLPKKTYVHFKGKYYGKIAKFHSKKTLVSRKRKFHLNFL